MNILINEIICLDSSQQSFDIPWTIIVHVNVFHYLTKVFTETLDREGEQLIQSAIANHFLTRDHSRSVDKYA